MNADERDEIEALAEKVRADLCRTKHRTVYAYGEIEDECLQPRHDPGTAHIGTHYIWVGECSRLAG